MYMKVININKFDVGFQFNFIIQLLHSTTKKMIDYALKSLFIQSDIQINYSNMANRSIDIQID